MELKLYKPHHKTSVVKLLRANTPEYFAPSEEVELKDYLENKREDYFVVEEQAEIIGAGGINYFPVDKTARISWDMIHPEHHGKSIGTALTQYKIDLLVKNPTIDIIIVRTSQLANEFYEKMGFELINIQQDFWANGLHLYEMRRMVSN